MPVNNFLTLEDNLEVNKLYNQKIESNKHSMYDELYNRIKADDEDMTNNATDEDSSDSEDITSVKDSSDVEDIVLSEESFKDLYYISLAQESFIGDYASKLSEAFKDSLSYLGYLGITYGPTIATNVYRGLVYAMGRLTKLLFTSISKIVKYSNRRINSFNKLKNDINKLKQILSEIKSKNNSETDIKISYSNIKNIDNLKINTNTDLFNTVNVLNNFLNSSIKDIGNNIVSDISYIKHITSNYLTIDVKTPLASMIVKPMNNCLTNRNISGFNPSSDKIEPSAYKETLPGDIEFIAYLPKDTMNNLDDAITAYNNSNLFLGYNMNSYKSVQYINYMNIDDLSKLLEKFSSLCDTCIEQQKLYESIIKYKKGLRFNFRNYFYSLINSKSKISTEKTLIEYVYLKSMFIDKVYISSAMDIHDYSIKVISSGLSYIKSNIDQY